MACLAAGLAVACEMLVILVSDATRMTNLEVVVVSGAAKSGATLHVGSHCGSFTWSRTTPISSVPRERIQGMGGGVGGSQ